MEKGKSKTTGKTYGKGKAHSKDNGSGGQKSDSYKGKGKGMRPGKGKRWQAKQMRLVAFKQQQKSLREIMLPATTRHIASRLLLQLAPWGMHPIRIGIVFWTSTNLTDASTLWMLRPNRQG